MGQRSAGMKKLHLAAYRLFFLLFILAVLFSCTEKEKKAALENFQYEKFKDSLLSIKSATGLAADTVNILDTSLFIPGRDSLDTLLKNIDTIWHREIGLMARLDSVKKGLKNIAGFTPEEKAVIQENTRVVDSFLRQRDTLQQSTCRAKECIIYVVIDKSAQQMLLYLMGELKDSFKVSTGKGKYETPEMALHPRGPILTRYTSRKFPGGNYQGLGNMPYAVFLKGGYAIHGTTTGNFAKLGSRASHGCIRLHPDHAKIFYALVKIAGLSQTWVEIKDSIPPIAE